MNFLKVLKKDFMNKFDELVNTCNSMGEEIVGATFFAEPLAEGVLSNWEKETNITIPKSYREWLKCTGYCQIDRNLAEFYSPDMFMIMRGSNTYFVQIGNLIGDGEKLCFSTSDGMFYKMLDGYISNPIKTFDDILKEICRMLKADNESVAKTFNSLEVSERRKRIEGMKDGEREAFITDMRRQAVRGFWRNERELLNNGQCTRDWTPEQMEQIFNISEQTGMMSKNAGVAMEVDVNGVPKLNPNGKYIYYIGRHLANVSVHPEYAAEPRNMQALDTREYMESFRRS